ncbi:MAG: M36 family metallopeptidase, partial [bacterium]
MRTSSRALVAATALLTVAAVAFAAGPAGNAAGSNAQGAVDSGGIQGDRQPTKEKDNRKGVVAPTARQLARAAALHARARWNRLGTPAVLAATGTPLATGLGADPVQAAKAYVAANRDVLGLTRSGADALE